jgi:glycosyltransferase involved in cell wall biosynthesis
VNVLFLGPLPPPVTGHALACQVLLEELRRGRNVDVVNLGRSGLRQGVDSLSRVVEVLRMLAQVRRKARRADLIYFTVSESFAGNLKDLAIYALCFGRLRRMVIHLHGGAGLSRLLLGPRGLRRRLNEALIGRLAGAIVLGGRHTGIFAQALPPARIHVAPNFAEDYLFSSVAGIRTKFEDVAPLRVVFLSNLIAGKGHEELVDAFLSLDAGVRRGFRIDFAGGFESDAARSAFLGRIAGAPELAYHGVVSGAAKQQLLARAHVFCLPTYYAYEGQPISILEAYASGCAVVTTDHSGIFDVFTPAVNGLAVEKRSPASLAAALLEARRDPAALLAMALRNREQAEREYRVSRHCARVLAALDRCVAA